MDTLLSSKRTLEIDFQNIYIYTFQLTNFNLSLYQLFTKLFYNTREQNVLKRRIIVPNNRANM